MRSSLLASSSPPALSPDTVLFIGNGILRVPSWVGLDPHENGKPLTTPSWSEYMDQLWRLVRASRRGDESLLPLHDFSRLSPPRQAEWFDHYYQDRHYQDQQGLTPWQLSALRLHLLGVELHPKAGLLTNALLLRVAKLVVNVAIHQPVDVFTTNLDCSLEQNIAWALEQWCELNKTDSPAEIEVMAGFRPSVTWKRAGNAALFPRVRIWKIHGCLRDLKSMMDSSQWSRLQRSLRQHPELKDTSSEFCGWLPETHCLAPELGGKWSAVEKPQLIEHGEESAGIFSISEYFRSLTDMVRLDNVPPSSASAPEANAEFARFAQLLRSRPLLLLGYSLLEEDVDIVYLLQTYQSPQERVILIAKRDWDESQEARFEQMGVRSWTYEVEPVGFCLDPGRLKRAARHEWRVTGETELQSWRTALQQVRANAWLAPQRECVDQLLSGEDPLPLPREHRLVFAGLASIWHAFSLRQESDFPVRRRVSAGYTSVDAQVPGGSGLVPCMEAAAMAGPKAAGRLAFLTNVPRAWSSWFEIEEFCLSAGVDVRPHLPAEEDPALQIGRTSYVLLWNLPQNEKEAQRPKQRFIIDVPSIADEKLANQMGELKSPKAQIEQKFQSSGREDLLFADKETETASLIQWKGPLIFETGASGTELVATAGQQLRPTLWTSGIGSLLRTLVVATGCLPESEKKFPKSSNGVLAVLDRQPDLKPFLSCPPEPRRRYVAKLVSFNRKPWREGGLEGFLYTDELAYGQWLFNEWWTMGAKALDFLNARNLLGDIDAILGRGILTTIHEGGLMGAWEMADGSRLLVRVHVDRNEQNSGQNHLSHSIVCEAQTIREQGKAAAPQLSAQIDIAKGMTLRIAGTSQELQLGNVARWNTLAAGDTVRGALAYGLWAYRHHCEPAPRDIPHILFASTTLATMKCYAGSFVNYMSLIELLRTGPVWSKLWGTQAPPSPASRSPGET